MKITFLLLILGFVQVSAATYAQNVSLNVKNAPLTEVFTLLRAESGYNFLYDPDLLDQTHKITLSLKKIPFVDALNLCFKNQPVAYVITDKNVVIRKREREPVVVTAADVQINVSGTVADEKGNPIPGATVVVKGLSGGTATDKDGKFSIGIINGDLMLTVSSLGYEKQDIQINGRTTINVVLKSSNSTLNDVVVVGYGSQRKKDVTGSVASISSKDIDNRPVTNPLDALSSKIPGLTVSANSGAPGGQFQVSMRGISSINGGTSPLVVIDGIIDGNLQDLNPNDIATIDVLKDASSTAIYGVRGANGVIIVTTKRAKAGQLSVTYNGNFSTQVEAHEPQQYNASQFMEWFSRAYSYDPTRAPIAGVYASMPKLLNPDGAPLYDIDYNKAILQHNVSQKHYLSVLGSSEKTRQSLSVGYEDEQGLIQHSYYKNYTARFTSETDITKGITIGGEMGYSTNTGNTLNSQTTIGAAIIRGAGEAFPVLPLNYPDGSYSHDIDFYNLWGNINPLEALNESSDIVKTDQLLGSIHANLKLAPGLQFRTSFSTRINDNSEYLNQPGTAWNSTGNTSINGGKTAYWQFDNFLTYDKSFGDHALNITAGSSQSESNTNLYGLAVSQTQGNLLSYYNIGGNAIDPTLERISSNFIKQTTNSYFARVNYSYLSRYLLTVTSRYDGASVFGQANKYALFPSGAVAWVASNEDFLKNNAVISFLKFRGSYGITGNSAIQPYSTLKLLTSSPVFINNQGLAAVVPGQLGNEDLKWERTSQLDLGVDLHAFNERLIFTGDIYRKVSNNLLFNEPISTVSGYSNILTNIGSMRNTGLELSLSGDVVKSADWNLNLGAILSANSNKILKLSDNNQDIYGGSTALGYAPLIFRVGQPAGSLWAVQRIGTWGTAEAAQAALYGDRPGDLKYADLNGDHVINNSDAKISGNIFPKYTGSFSTNLRYKNWQLVVEIQFNKGNKVFDGEDIVYGDWGGQYGRGYTSNLANAWTPQHQNTDVQQLRLVSDHGFFNELTGNLDSHWLEDGSFIRGQNLNLNYNFPKAVYEKLKVKGLKVYADVSNFFLITKYPGFDPQTGNGNTLDQSIFGQSIEWESYPKPRIFTFGLTVNL